MGMLMPILKMRKISTISGILLDLGVSSIQLLDSKRGFSFQKNGLLDMRMDITKGESVAKWLTYASTKEIIGVLQNYGEEQFAVTIAKKIADYREKKNTSESLLYTE